MSIGTSTGRFIALATSTGLAMAADIVQVAEAIGPAAADIALAEAAIAVEATAAGIGAEAAAGIADRQPEIGCGEQPS